MGGLNSPRGWLGIGIFAAIIILLIGWFFLVSPQRDRVSSLQKETTSAIESEQSLLAKAAALKKQAEELPAMRAKLEDLADQLPDADGVDQVLRQIENATSAAGLTVQSFSASNPVSLDGGGSTAADATAAAAGALQYIPLTIDIEGGNYNAYLAYLNLLENLDRALLVTDVSIQGGETTAMNLSARIFMKPGSSASSPSGGSSSTAGSGSTATPAPTGSQAPPRSLG